MVLMIDLIRQSICNGILLGSVLADRMSYFTHFLVPVLVHSGCNFE